MSLTGRYEVRGRIYYDQVKEIIATKEEVESKEDRDFYEDFAFFKEVSGCLLQWIANTNHINLYTHINICSIYVTGTTPGQSSVSNMP